MKMHNPEVNRHELKMTTTSMMVKITHRIARKLARIYTPPFIMWSYEYDIKTGITDTTDTAPLLLVLGTL